MRRCGIGNAVAGVFGAVEIDIAAMPLFASVSADSSGTFARKVSCFGLDNGGAVELPVV